MKISKTQTVEVEAKTISIYTKVCDSFTADLLDAEGKVIHRQENDYVPGFMPGEHYGDYIILEIDIETGVITNWNKPTVQQLENFCGADDE